MLLPSCTDHSDHAIDDKVGLSQDMDKHVSEKIEGLVQDGLRNLDDMKRYLKYYVEKELFNVNEFPCLVLLFSIG